MLEYWNKTFRRRSGMQRSGGLVALSLFLVLAGLCASCGKQEPAQSSTSAAPSPASPAAWRNTWQPSPPPGLTIKDGGACFFDALNGAALADGPIRVKSGAPLSLAGWAVADLKAGRLGSAVGIQLNAPAPYFIAADAYVRPGLGAALKNSSLDGGGLRLNTTPLDVPAGDYRVLFLVQSYGELLRCDTGRVLRVE
jgi:hypothetical protein